MSISRLSALLLTVLAWLYPQLAWGDDDPQPVVEGPPPAPAAPAPAPAPEAAPAEAPATATVAQSGPDCLQLSGDADQAAEAVGAIKFALGDTTQTLTDIRVVGLSTLSLDVIWPLVGYRPNTALTVEQATALIARLAQTGLFARITPTVRLSPDPSGHAVLELALIENPTIRAIDIRGLSELTREEVLEELLVAPEGDDDDDEEITIRVGKTIRIRRDRLLSLRCTAPVPPRVWLAHHVNDTLVPGLVWRGLKPGLSRVQRYLRREGYLLAQVSATLTRDGTLVIAIDEGRLESVTIDGVHPALQYDVQRLLGVAPGAIMNLSDIRNGLDRVRARFPFLATSDRRHRAQPSLAIGELPQADGSVQYTFYLGPPRCDDGEEDNWFSSFVRDNDDRRKTERALRDCAYTSSWYELDGRRLTIHLSADHGDLDGNGWELVRHTPVTGWAPGMLLTLRAWDPADRAHFRFDTLFNVNTSRPNVAARGSGTLDELAAAERIDMMVSPSIAVPRLGIAELGGALYTLTDTDDNWRVTRIDSYLNSGLFGRPERDYYRRTGASAFATFHHDQLTFGGEYRYDRYGSLATVDDPDTLIGDHIAINPAITDGIAGAMVLRVEWATDKATPYDIDAVTDRRPSQGSIVRRPSPFRVSNGLRTVATLEVADPSLGGSLKYWRATSNSMLSVSTGHDSGATLRFRIAGGSDLPIQRQEALGGWGSLRGFGFKELAGGDRSMLLNLEYRFEPLTAFVDAGTIRSPMSDGQQVRLGLGTALALGDSGQLAFAWRTDDQATWTPEIRLLFGRPW